MKKISIIILLISLSIVFTIILILNGNKKIIEKIYVNENSIELEFFVQNKSWETGYYKSIPYKKGDELDFFIMIKNYDDLNKIFTLNNSKIKEYIDIEDLKIEEEEVVIEGKDVGVIRFSGKAKKSGIMNDSSQKNKKDIVNYQVTKYIQNDLNDNEYNGNKIDFDNNNQNIIDGSIESEIISSKEYEIEDNIQEKIVNGDDKNIIDDNNVLGDNSINDYNSSTYGTNSGSTNSQNEKSNEKEIEKINEIVIFFDKKIYSSNVTNLIKVSGTNVNLIKSIGIADKVYSLFKHDDDFFIKVPKGDLPNGTHFVFALKYDDTIKSVDQTLTFKYVNQEVVIIDFFPKVLQNDTARWLTVQGVGLKNTISIQLSNTVIFQKTDFQIASDNVIAVKIPGNLQPGNYYLNIMTTNGIFEFVDTGFEIKN